MKNRYPLGEIEIRGNRLYLIQRFGSGTVEQDVTPLWNFFKDLEKYMKNPTPINDVSRPKKVKEDE